MLANPGLSCLPIERPFVEPKTVEPRDSCRFPPTLRTLWFLDNLFLVLPVRDPVRRCLVTGPPTLTIVRIYPSSRVRRFTISYDGTGRLALRK
jgi:hypothetical protein